MVDHEGDADGTCLLSLMYEASYYCCFKTNVFSMYSQESLYLRKKKKNQARPRPGLK